MVLDPYIIRSTLNFVLGPAKREVDLSRREKVEEGFIVKSVTVFVCVCVCEHDQVQAQLDTAAL